MSPRDCGTGTFVIPLTQGMCAVVDAADFPLVAPYQWCAIRNGRQRYALAHIPKPNGGRTTVRMHRLIVGAGPADHVDHIDCDGLNNRRANLRICSRAENSRNRRIQRHNTSGYKGVYRLHESRYRATIHHAGRRWHLGYFRTAEDAARAYDRAARRFYGEFARLNFAQHAEAA